MNKLKYDPLNIVVCGTGGQGNVLASELIGSTMTEMGYKVAVGETYGASQRGGSVMSHVRVSENLDLGVLISSGEANFIIAFEPLEALRIARQYANEDTYIIYETRPIYPLGVLRGNEKYPEAEDIKAELNSISKHVFEVPAVDIAQKAGDTKAANIALLGAFSQMEGTPLSAELLSEILEKRFKGAVLEINRKAFEMGCASVKKEDK